jgi:protein TonB
MGDVRLAAPVMNRKRSKQDTSESAPELEPQGVSAGEGLGSMAISNGNQPAAPLPIGGDVKPAVLLSSVPPVYPALAKTQHVNGDVKIDAFIDATGHVTATKVLSGPTLLHQSAMAAVKQWRYQPATLNGNAVPMHLTVTLQFRLQ